MRALSATQFIAYLIFIKKTHFLRKERFIFGKCAILLALNPKNLIESNNINIDKSLT